MLLKTPVAVIAQVCLLHLKETDGFFKIMYYNKNIF